MDLMRLGICKNDACLAAGSGPVELYDGPGRYCPDCGDVLLQYVPGKSAWSLPKSPAPHPKPREGPLAAFSFRSRPLALSAALVVAAGAIAVLWTMAVGHSRVPGSVGVYVSSMIAPVARDDLHEYVVRSVPSPRPITDAQFEKLLADLDAKGTTTQLSPLITTSFGLTHQGETLTVHQDAFADEAKNVHGLVKLGNGNYLFGYIEMYASHLYYVDKHLVLIAAMVDSFKGGGDKISMPPNKDAQKGLDAELTFFAHLAACPNFDCP